MCGVCSFFADPLYADITWGAGGSTSELTVQIARKMQEAGFETNMHLTWYVSVFFGGFSNDCVGITILY